LGLTRDDLTTLVIALKDIHRELKLLRLLHETELSKERIIEYESKVKNDEFLNIYRQGES
jgi:hypothetical protein